MRQENNDAKLSGAKYMTDKDDKLQAVNASAVRNAAITSSIFCDCSFHVNGATIPPIQVFLLSYVTCVELTLYDAGPSKACA